MERERAQPMPRHRLAQRLAGPPGLPFVAGTIISILVVLEGRSRESLTTMAIGVMLAGVLASICLVRLVIDVLEGGRGLRVRDIARWLVIPVLIAVGLGSAAILGNTPMQVRFALSRSAFDRMAVDVVADGTLVNGQVGAYQVRNAKWLDDGFWFVIANDGLSRWGFAYSPSGEPQVPGDQYSPLWQRAVFEHFEGPWWTWTQWWD
jgi:hypothetical protein